MLWQKLRSLVTSATPQLEIYTDGSLKRERGAWAFIIVSCGKVIHEASGYQKLRLAEKSSNRMEFQAAIEALSWLPKTSDATLYSDSRNLVDTMTLWVEAWADQAWVKKNKRPIPNVDLIQKLYSLEQQHTLEWRWIPAHAGNPHNERCDELCRMPVPSQDIMK